MAVTVCRRGHSQGIGEGSDAAARTPTPLRDVCNTEDAEPCDAVEGSTSPRLHVCTSHTVQVATHERMEVVACDRGAPGTCGLGDGMETVHVLPDLFGDDRVIIGLGGACTRRQHHC